MRPWWAIAIAACSGAPAPPPAPHAPPPARAAPVDAVAAAPAYGYDGIGTRTRCTQAEAPHFDCAAGPEKGLADTCRAQGKQVLSCRCDVLCAERLDFTFGPVPAVRTCPTLIALGRLGFTVARANASFRFVDTPADCAKLGAGWSAVADIQPIRLDLFFPMHIAGGRAVDSCVGDECIGVAIGAGSDCFDPNIVVCRHDVAH